jgi:dienelactone hydrolase
MLVSATAAAGVLMAAPGGLRAQAAGSYTLRMTVGSDTVGSEVVARTSLRVVVDMENRLAGGRWQYALTVAPDERVTAMTAAFYRAAQGDAAPYQTIGLELRSDSVIADLKGAATRVERIGSRPGAVPYINPSGAMLEQVLLRARALREAGGGQASVDTVPIFAVQGGSTTPVTVRWVGADSAVLRLGGVEMRARLSGDGGLLSLEIPAQNVRFERVEGAHPLAPEKIDYGPPPDAPYTALDVTVHTPAGLDLTGTLTLPAKASGSVPAVVTITGSGAEDRDERIPIVRGYRPFWQIADTLARRGIATLRLDDRGVNGSSPGPDSATSADYADDIRAALGWLRARKGIDGRRLALVGHSEGGLIAPMVAATDASLRGIVLMAGPAYTGRRILEYQLRSAVEGAPAFTPAERDSALASIPGQIAEMAGGNAWLRFFLAYDPVQTARKVRVPVLVLQGETDHQVTPEQADTLAAAFRAGGDPDVTLRKFPDTNHLFVPDPNGSPTGYALLRTRTLRPEVLGAIADWLAEHLR